MDRVSYKWGHTWSERYQQTVLFNTRTPKPPYPHAKLKFFKGETHGLFSAKMTEFLLESFHGRMFFEWCMDTGHASEHYWNTLNYNPHLHAPGGYTGGLAKLLNSLNRVCFNPIKNINSAKYTLQKRSATILFYFQVGETQFIVIIENNFFMLT